MKSPEEGMGNVPRRDREEWADDRDHELHAEHGQL